MLGGKTLLNLIRRNTPMRNLSSTLLLAVFVLPLLSQCASQDELNQIHYQLRMLNKKVSDLESTTIDDIQKRQAVSASQIDRLHNDFLELKGGLEETGHLNRRLKEQSKELETAFKTYTKQEQEKRLAEVQRLEQELIGKDQQLENLAEQMKMQQEHLKAIQQARVEEAKRKAAAAAKAAEEARQKAEAANKAAQGSAVTRIKADRKKLLITASAAPTISIQPAISSAGTAPPSPSATGSALKGKNLFDQGKFREAYQVYENIAKGGEATGTGIDAKFMMGECLFALKEYDQAILDYQNIITNHPSSAKAPAAMLRQAMAFENLNDKDTAKILYKKLVATYKQSPEAAQAQKKLDSM
jgi:TolA-binding protein